MSNQKICVITGCPGMDFHALAAILLEKGNKVIGVHRRSSGDVLDRAPEFRNRENFSLYCADVTDSGSMLSLLRDTQPDEFYNLAAQSDVRISFDQPQLTFMVNTLGVLNQLEAIRTECAWTKYYCALTSECFGNNKNPNGLRDENTPLWSRSPYGTSKIAAYHTVRNYREAYGIFACCGFLFNHTGVHRGLNFVERKITNYVGWLYNALKNHDFEMDHEWAVMPDEKKLSLGNLDAQRDIGASTDFCYGMWLMLQQDSPEDFVLATGKTHSIREILDAAFDCIDIKDWGPYVKFDSSMLRPTEVDVLIGDASKAKRVLGWEPTRIFKSLISDMVENDIQRHSRAA